MRSESGLELKVGIFILIGIIVLFIIVFSIGDVYIMRPGYHIKVKFDFANGIDKSAPVRLAGIEVGEVDAIRIYYDEEEGHTQVELSALIKEDVMIENNSRACINTLGLLGEKYLEIFPGRGDKFLEDGDTLVGENPIPMEEVTRDLKQLADSARTVIDRLKKGEGTIGKLLVEEKIYRDLESFVEDIKRNPWKLLHKPRRSSKKKSEAAAEEPKKKQSFSPRKKSSTQND